MRQLVYDLRNWGSLEPTGRLGSDEGYDARGTEIIEEAPPSIEDEDGVDQLEETAGEERLWQIQCKRERSISPSKIARYIDEMIPETVPAPYGVIFAAPTDFSKKTRDVFKSKLRQKGVREFFLWGKADLEDALYQPKNDHLMYAYFGISLQIQKRAQKTALRSILAIKRKAIRHLGAITQRSFTELLIRDIDDVHYPYPGGVPDFSKNPAWKKYYFVGHEHDGIQVLVKKYFAYRDVEYGPPKGEPNLKAWDFTTQGNMQPNDPWNDDPEDSEVHQSVYHYWRNLDQARRAHFEIVGLVKYENIIDIDPDGDIYAQCPHAYVKRMKDSSFFDGFTYRLASADIWGSEVYLPANADKLRIKVFPELFPQPQQEEGGAPQR